MSVHMVGRVRDGRAVALCGFSLSSTALGLLGRKDSIVSNPDEITCPGCRRKRLYSGANRRLTNAIHSPSAKAWSP